MSNLLYLFTDTCPPSPTTTPTGLVPTGKPLIPTVALPVTIFLTPSVSVLLKSPPKIYSSTTTVALSVSLSILILCVLLLSISMLCVLYKRHKTGQGHGGKKQNPRVLNESLLEPPQTDLEHVTLPPQVVGIALSDCDHTTTFSLTEFFQLLLYFP